jgi:hypothetical protein
VGTAQDVAGDQVDIWGVQVSVGATDPGNWVDVTT